jgi:hypothetical protein
MYFDSREISAIALSASLWAVINAIIGPVFWNMTHLPILCDMLGIATLSLTAWWVRKRGSSIVVGLIATLISFIINPGGVQFLGFTGASFVFEGFTIVMGYDRMLEKSLKGRSLLLVASIVSTMAAGAIIGTFFMNSNFLASAFGGILFFTMLHGAGGFIGGLFGIIIVKGLGKRQIVK